MFKNYLLKSSDLLINRGWTSQNAFLISIMFLLFLEGVLITFVVTLGSFLLGLDTYTNFKITSFFTGLFALILVVGAIINYIETKKI